MRGGAVPPEATLLLQQTGTTALPVTVHTEEVPIHKPAAHTAAAAATQPGAAAVQPQEATRVAAVAVLHTEEDSFTEKI